MAQRFARHLTGMLRHVSAGKFRGINWQRLAGSNPKRPDHRLSRL